MGWWASIPWWVWMLGGMFFLSKVLHRRAWRWRTRYLRPGIHGVTGTVIMSRGRCGAWGWSHAPYSRTHERVASQPIELSPKEKQERAVAELRRRYVADDITVEQYEQELDRLLREK